MQKIRIPFADTGYFSETVIDYLNGSTKLAPFVPYTFPDADLAEMMQAYAKHPVDRALLFRLLQADYAGLETIPQVDENMHTLQDENTFCIITAHQLNIFTGPLYVIYKTLSAVRQCRIAEQKYPGKKFIPVFWLGSEDHDFEEINHAHVFGNTILWEDRQGGACGRYSTSSLHVLLDAVQTILGTGEHADTLNRIFRNGYEQNTNLASATRSLLHQLFGTYGLLVVDGDHLEAKSMCSDIIMDELFARSTESIVHKTLEAFPYPPQATPREINLFYVKGHLRERIVTDGKIYSVLETDITFTEEQMRAEVAEHPERFSPNVLLRPLFQQRLVPAVMFVGGGGELAYWLLLKDVFAHHDTVFPFLQLRDSFILGDEKIASKLEKLDLQIRDFFQDTESIIRFWLEKQFGDALALDAEKETVQKVYADILEKMRKIDPAFETAVLAEQKNVMNSMDKLEAKLRKAEKNKQDTSVHQIRTIHEKLFPAGGLQERNDNFIPFYLTCGPELFTMLLDAPEDAAPAFTILLA